MSLELTNLVDGELVPHVLCLLDGVSDGCEHVDVELNGEAVATATKGAYDRFKAVIRLQQGDNEVRLSGKAEEGGDEVAELVVNLVCEPATGEHYVNLLYLTCSDSDGSFQAPEGVPNDKETGMQKQLLAAQLDQMLLAEMLKRKYPELPRRTFALSEGVEEFQLDLTLEEAWAKPGRNLWQYIRKQTLPENQMSVIQLGLMSFTKWDGEKALAHCALGGKTLALFGSGSMYTWPTTVEEIIPAFSNPEPLPEDLFDDAKRKQYGKSCATTIGATLHEVGHCLSLHHPGGEMKGIGIMARGFDKLYRTFVTVEPFKRQGKYQKEDETDFDMSSSSRLMTHYFLTQSTPGEPPVVSLSGDEVIVTCEDGLGQISFYFQGNSHGYIDYLMEDEQPTEVNLGSMDDMKEAYQADGDIVVSACSVNGAITGVKFSALEG